MNMHPQGGVANRDQRPNTGVDVCKQHLDVCLGTLEDRIDQMIDSKKDLAEQVVGVGESWLTELSTTELREVFTLRRGAVEDE